MSVAEISFTKHSADVYMIFERTEGKMSISVSSVKCPVCHKSHIPASGHLSNGVYASTCENCGFFFKFRAQGPTISTATFSVNGVQYTEPLKEPRVHSDDMIINKRVNSVWRTNLSLTLCSSGEDGLSALCSTTQVGSEYNPASSLLDFLRSNGISLGTKQMCIEGGCGVCLVTATLYDPITDRQQIYTVNSCLVRIFMCDGWEITTIEGLGNPQTGLHPIQDRLAMYNGSQCGFCSPSQVINMYGLLQRNPKPTMQQVEDCFDSTICRCTGEYKKNGKLFDALFLRHTCKVKWRMNRAFITQLPVLCASGYRSILDAMKSFAVDAPLSLPGGSVDIEDLIPKFCKKSGKPCLGQCDSKQDMNRLQAVSECKSGTNLNLPLHIVGDSVQWFKPTTLEELYQLLNQYRTSNYRLLFGDSGYGIYKEIGPWMYSVLIDIRGIRSLYTFEVNETITLGANLSLVNLEDLFDHFSTDPATSYFSNFADHIRQVASSSVRNIASWAGNLMLKHAHPDFVSDIYTIFETVGTRLIIGDGNGSETTYNMADFLTLDMHGKVIISALMPTYNGSSYSIKTYRATQRVQNCHGYVTAGFNLKLDKTNNYTVMERPTLVFQGISGTLNHATITEGRLLGQQLGDAQVLRDTLTALSQELVPTSDPVLADPTFRRNLAVALFYRFVLSVCTDKVSLRYQSGSTALERPLSSGTQIYDTNEQEWPVNEPMANMEAVYQTAGLTRFLDDLPLEQRELHAALVISTNANARIASMDASTAMQLPGVFKFIQASDFPAGGQNNFMPLSSYPSPEEILCSGQVVYGGQPLGIIVADDPQTAATAASMVRVTYTDIQPPILDLQAAIEQQSFFPNPPDPLIVGNPDEAISQSARRVTGSIEMGTQYHFHLETQISRCVPNDNGGMDVQASTQWIDATAEVVARVLGIPQSSVTVEAKRLGGAFGGKISRNLLVSGACALAAYIMQRPIRLRLDMHVNMKALGKRFPYLANYEVGFTDDGKLNGVRINYYADCGYSDNDNAMQFMYSHMDNAYYCENWKLTPIGVKTNKPSNTACRSPGSLPAQFIMESIMEHVAKSLNKDPTEVRKINFFEKGQTTATGMKLDYCNIKDVVNQLEITADLPARQQQVLQFNQENRWKKRGLSLVPTRFGIYWANGFFEVIVTIYHSDGTIAIQHGGIEVGQGINTKAAQVCAYELDVPMSLIRVKKGSTISNANSSLTGGSITSELNCMGVIQCCQTLKSRMAPVKQKLQNPTWQHLVTECFRMGIDLTAHAYTNPYDQYGFHYNVYAATVLEVELDVLTGQSQINRVDMLYDCGNSLNPEIDIGQLEGGFMMGLGYHLTEKIKYDPDTGVMLTDGTWEYKPPLPKELPVDFRITLLKNAINPNGVLRSKTAGEPPLMMASSALFAIKHAIEAVRAEIQQDTFFPLNSPALVEDIQSACLLDLNQFTFGQ